MPRIEQVRYSALSFLGRLRRRVAFLLAVSFGRLIPRQRSVLFFPLAIAVVVASIVFAAVSSSGQDCTQVTPTAASTAHGQHTKICKAPPPTLGFERLTPLASRGA